jgi:hypothetical protein
MSPPTNRNAGPPPGSGASKLTSRRQATDRPQDSSTHKHQTADDRYPTSFREWHAFLSERPFGQGWTA